jgi:UDP-glucose 4-epimerase
MTALVTGGAGFLGSHVAEHLLGRGVDVIVLDDLSGGLIENLPLGARFIEGSVTDDALVRTVFEENDIEHVYHLAAYAAEGLSHHIRKYNYTNNLVGSMTLINQSVLHRVRCYVFTSSIAVYGAGQTPMTEALVPRPEDPYGVAKYAVELDLEAARRYYGLNYVVFRPHNVYGERQNIADKYRNVVGIFLRQVLDEMPMTIFGDGMQTRAFSHINDITPIIADSPYVDSAQGEVFNVGGDVVTTVLDLAHLVAEAMGVEPNIRHLAPRHEVVHTFASHEKVRVHFGGVPETSLSEGIARMAAWARTVARKPTSDFANIEVPVRLPEAW